MVSMCYPRFILNFTAGLYCITDYINRLLGNNLMSCSG